MRWTDDEGRTDDEGQMMNQKSLFSKRIQSSAYYQNFVVPFIRSLA